MMPGGGGAPGAVVARGWRRNTHSFVAAERGAVREPPGHGELHAGAAIHGYIQSSDSFTESRCAVWRRAPHRPESTRALRPGAITAVTARGFLPSTSAIQVLGSGAIADEHDALAVG